MEMRVVEKIEEQFKIALLAANKEGTSCAGNADEIKRGQRETLIGRGGFGSVNGAIALGHDNHGTNGRGIQDEEYYFVNVGRLK